MSILAGIGTSVWVSQLPRTQ